MSKAGFRQKMAYGLIAVMILSFLVTSLPKCMPDKKPPVAPPSPASTVHVPSFSGDSAFAYVKKQVDFGPRVPGSPAHKACAAWLSQEFKKFGLTVIEQPFKAKAYFATLDAVNIIAQYKPELPNRIMLCSHWDSRHVGDKDTKDKDKPIDGADDGASGVGVMLEIARMLQQNPVEYGVDLICFDAEDLGDDREPESGASIMAQNRENTAETWCLGSQYWSQNLHKPGYKAHFGMLFDMVGASGAKFPREGYSMEKAPEFVNRIWAVAAELGFDDLFINTPAGAITDDHFFVMRGTNIPTVDIIGMPKSPPMFGDHHHTHFDNMSIIDDEILRKVGQVTATVIYRAAAQPQ